MKKLGLFLVCVLSLQAVTFGLTLQAPNYTVETYATYSLYDHLRDITFDSQGNLYTANIGQGTIYKIAPDKTMTTFATGLGSPCDMFWGTGDYGNYLYVAEPGSNRISRITPAGVRTTFAQPSSSPEGMGFDRQGNYGLYLYSGTNSNDHIWQITPSGSVSMFSPFPYNEAGVTATIAFDPGTYGGKMFIGNISQVDPTYSGLWSMDQAGNATRFCSDLALAAQVDFLNGQMFVQGMTDAYANAWTVFTVDQQGQITPFATGAVTSITVYDGSLYVNEKRYRNLGNGQATFDNTIYKITAIPEPMTILVMALGGLGLWRRGQH